MADKLREQRDLEALQARHVGTGSADTTSREWRTNVARDTSSSILGHPPLLNYYAIGTGQCRERARIELLERMIAPSKPPEAKVRCIPTFRFEQYTELIVSIGEAED